MTNDPDISRLLRCLDAEQREEEARYGMEARKGFKQLRADGVLLHPLRVVRKSFGWADYPEFTFRLPYPTETSRFRDGCPVHCFQAEEEPVKGQLAEFDGREGRVRLFAPDFPDWLEDDGVGIRIAPDIRTIRMMQEAVSAIPGDRRQYATFRGLQGDVGNGKAYTKQQLPEIEGIRNRRLNPAQREAVALMLGDAAVCVVHGPPGTGKTTTVTEGIVQLAERGEKVLAAAPANAAVDHLARSLAAAGLRVLRLGNTGKVHPDILPYTPEGALAAEGVQKDLKALRIRAEEFRRMALRYKRRFGKEEREQRALLFQEVKTIRKEIISLQDYHLARLFERADAVIGTPVGLMDALPKEAHFPVLVIDEAGQCPEPLAWCLIPRAERTVLAGDHCQLPPTVLSGEAARMGLDRSILERAVDSGCPLTLLDTQYRMRASIAGFSSEWFYGARLRTADALSDEGTHLTFIDTAGAGFNEAAGPDGASLVNEGELGIVAQLMEREGLPPMETAFVSPYAAQVAMAMERLPQGMRISTVDSFQGQEMRNIIVSLVRSNDEGAIGFLSDHRRMNVAITRARERLFVIGDSATIAADPFYSAFIDYAGGKGAYRSVWEFDI